MFTKSNLVSQLIGAVPRSAVDDHAARVRPPIRRVPIVPETFFDEMFHVFELVFQDLAEGHVVEEVFPETGNLEFLEEILSKSETRKDVLGHLHGSRGGQRDPRNVPCDFA